MDIITLKDLWDIRTLNFARTLFSCGFTLPDSINFDTSTQNSSYLFEATWETLQQFSKTKEIQE
jgi:hypothetical protein